MIPSLGLCSLPGDTLRCPLCVHAQTQVVQRLREAHTNMVGTLTSEALGEALLRSYKDEVLMTDEGIGELTAAGIREHFEQHTVAPHHQLAGDIMFCATVQRQYRRECAAKSGGEIALCGPAIQDWLKLSKHKMSLLQTYQNLLKPGKNTPEARPYDLS
jgi:hypothetical protein